MIRFHLDIKFESGPRHALVTGEHVRVFDIYSFRRIPFALARASIHENQSGNETKIRRVIFVDAIIDAFVIINLVKFREDLGKVVINFLSPKIP